MKSRAEKRVYGLENMDVFLPQTPSKSGIGTVCRLAKDFFPKVNSLLVNRKNLCRESEDGTPDSRSSAGMSAERFQVPVGIIYALYPKVKIERAARFIISFQSICDYLDNLCHRADIKDQAVIRQLHSSLLDAIDPLKEMDDYYRFCPYAKDDGRLKALVEDCKAQLRNLPSYGLVSEVMKKYARLYSDLQSLKHLPVKVREEQLKTWSGYYLRQYPGVSCWEFSAAAGSTLGIFALFVSAFDPMLTPEEAGMLDSAYFPWICGLHILLNNYIHTVDSMETGSINFAYYYKNLKRLEERLCFFIERSLECCSNLPYPRFHRAVVNGLVAFHLSDSKASMGLNRFASRNVLKKSPPSAVRYHKICCLLRTAGVLR